MPQSPPCGSATPPRSRRTAETTAPSARVRRGTTGRWSRQSSAATGPAALSVSEGPHAIEAVAVDRLGNVDEIPARREFDVILTPELPSIYSGPQGGALSDPQPRFEFRIPGAASARCRFDEQPFGPCSGLTSHSASAPLPSGTHTFEVQGFGGTGKPYGVTSATFAVDRDPPTLARRRGPPRARGQSTAALPMLR